MLRNGRPKAGRHMTSPHLLFGGWVFQTNLYPNYVTALFRGFPKGKNPIAIAFIFFFSIETSHFPIGLSVKYPRMIRTTNEIWDRICAFSFLVRSRFLILDYIILFLYDLLWVMTNLQSQWLWGCDYNLYLHFTSVNNQIPSKPERNKKPKKQINNVTNNLKTK